MNRLNSPTEISNCLFWLDASDKTTMRALSSDGAANINDGGSVGYWSDKSGNSRDFTINGADNSRRPVFIESLSALQFTGSLSNLLSRYEPSNVLLGASTVFVVVCAAGTQPLDFRLLSCATNGTASSNYSPFVGINSGVNNTMSSIHGGTNYGSRTGFIPAQLNIFAHNHNGTSYLNYKNLDSHWNEGAGFGPKATEQIQTHTLNNNINTFRVGTGIGTTPSAVNGTYFSGNVHEIIWYTDNLTNEQFARVHYYLFRKWGYRNNVNIIPNRVIFPLKAGNWTDTDMWSVSAENSPFNSPLSGDIVYTNNFYLTSLPNTNIHVADLRDRNITKVTNNGGGIVFTDRIALTAFPGWIRSHQLTETGASVATLSSNFCLLIQNNSISNILTTEVLHSTFKHLFFLSGSNNTFNFTGGHRDVGNDIVKVTFNFFGNNNTFNHTGNYSIFGNYASISSSNNFTYNCNITGSIFNSSGTWTNGLNIATGTFTGNITALNLSPINGYTGSGFNPATSIYQLGGPGIKTFNLFLRQPRWVSPPTGTVGGAAFRQSSDSGGLIINNYGTLILCADNRTDSLLISMANNRPTTVNIYGDLIFNNDTVPPSYGSGGGYDLNLYGNFLSYNINMPLQQLNNFTMVSGAAFCTGKLPQLFANSITLCGVNINSSTYGTNPFISPVKRFVNLPSGVFDTYATGSSASGRTSLFRNTNIFTLLSGFNFSRVVGGYNFVLAQSANTNRWFGVGNGQDGVFGQGNNTNLTSFTLLTGDWSNIFAGYSQVFALSANTTQWFVAGRNNFGQLGIGNTNSPVNYFTPITGNWIGFAQGGSHSFALSSNNRWFSSGKNDSGQLALYTNNDTTTFTLITGNYSKIACGLNHTAALSSTQNRLDVWGSNLLGQIGLGTSLSASSAVRIPGTFLDVSCGDNFTCVLSTGIAPSLPVILSTGVNADGQLGLGDNNSRTSFHLVSTGFWDAVVCGKNFTFARNINTGTWAGVGNNITGQLGIGNNLSTNIFATTGTNKNLNLVCGEDFTVGYDILYTPNYIKYSVNGSDRFVFYATEETTVSLPNSGDVVNGLTYGFGALTGSMIVPPVSTVNAGVLVGSTQGNAYLAVSDFWTKPLSSIITEPNTVGDRIKKTLTFQALSAIADSLDFSKV